jgi:hypothetical protein
MRPTYNKATCRVYLVDSGGSLEGFKSAEKPWPEQSCTYHYRSAQHALGHTFFRVRLQVDVVEYGILWRLDVQTDERSELVAIDVTDFLRFG